jgi:hypothetical protein
MARSLGLSKLLVFGPSDVPILATFTAEALLKRLFRQFPNRVLGSSRQASGSGIMLPRWKGMTRLCRSGSGRRSRSMRFLVNIDGSDIGTGMPPELLAQVVDQMVVPSLE